MSCAFSWSAQPGVTRTTKKTFQKSGPFCTESWMGMPVATLQGILRSHGRAQTDGTCWPGLRTRGNCPFLFLFLCLSFPVPFLVLALSFPCRFPFPFLSFSFPFPLEANCPLGAKALPACAICLCNLFLRGYSGDTPVTKQDIIMTIQSWHAPTK